MLPTASRLAPRLLRSLTRTPSTKTPPAPRWFGSSRSRLTVAPAYGEHAEHAGSYAQSQSTSINKWGVAVALLFGGTLALDLSGTVDVHRVLGAPWPVSVRHELNEASRAERRGDFVAAVAFYTQAESAARKAAETSTWAGRLGATNDEMRTKLATISLARASALEHGGRLGDAFRVYETAFNELCVAPSSSDKMRAVALAQKLGDMAASGTVLLPSQSAPDTLENMDALAESYYSWAVSTMMPLALPPSIHGSRITASSGGQGIGATGPEPPVHEPLESGSATLFTEDAELQVPIQAAFANLKHLDVPTWSQTANLSQAMQSLAAFYASRDRPERAAQLYNHAISLVRSPGASSALPSAPDAPLQLATDTAALPSWELDAKSKCQAGALYYKLTNALLQASERPWAEQGATPTEAEARQANLRARAMASAREGLALIRATQADLGLPASPDTVTTIGQGSIAPLSSPTVPPSAAAADLSTQSEQEFRLAEAGLLFALGRALAAQNDDSKRVQGLYDAAAQAARPIAVRAPLTHEHVLSLNPSAEPYTREAAGELLADIALAQL